MRAPRRLRRPKRPHKIKMQAMLRKRMVRVVHTILKAKNLSGKRKKRNKKKGL